MTGGRFEKFLPISGVLAGVFFLAGFPLSKLPSSPDDSSALGLVHSHATVNSLAGVTAALCAVALLYFVTAIRMALRSGEAGESTYSSAAYGGGVMLAGVIALDACLRLTMVDAASKGDASSVATLAWLESDLWVCFGVAASVLLISTGLGGRRAAVLPKWLAGVTTGLGVLSLLGPPGFITFVVFPLWLIVSGIALIRRAADTVPHVPDTDSESSVAAREPAR